MTCHLPQTNRYSSAARRIGAVQTPQSQFGQGVDCSFFPLEVVNARLGHEGGADPAPRVQAGCLPIVSADGFSAGMAHIDWGMMMVLHRLRVVLSGLLREGVRSDGNSTLRL